MSKSNKISIFERYKKKVERIVKNKKTTHYFLQKGLDGIRHIICRRPYYILAEKWLRYTQDFDTTEYQAPLNPFKIVWVSPKKIKYKGFRDRSDIAPNFYWGKVKSGNWDKLTYREVLENTDKFRGSGNNRIFENHYIYTSFEQRFIQNKEWVNTDIYQIAKEELKNSHSFWNGCKNEKDILNRCRYIDELYREMKSNGYKTQSDLNNKGLLPSIREEIVVDIGRNGELLHIHSKHRLALAKILELEKIPVAIAVRHTEWMKQRDKIFQENNTSDHPDLYELTK